MKVNAREKHKIFDHTLMRFHQSRNYQKREKTMTTKDEFNQKDRKSCRVTEAEPVNYYLEKLTH